MQYRPLEKITQAATLLSVCAVLMAAGCSSGPGASGSFDHSYDVSGHIRLELTNTAGDVTITGSSDGKVHVHGDVTINGMSEQSAQNRLSEFSANPPVEQSVDVIRIGKDASRLRNTHITYLIEVPRDTELSTNVVSGSQTIRSLKGPVKAQSVSGSLLAENIEGDTQLSSSRGNVWASNMGDTVRATTISGNVTVAGAKSDVRANSQTGSIRVEKSGGRVEAEGTSGSMEILGLTGDAKIRTISGPVVVHGNPSANSFWDLKTTSGSVEIGVAQGANFHLLAEASSGDVRADVPIMIEEQGKHSLRAQIGTGGARIEVHTISGEIHLRPAS
jgi:DUF4097 and DUF4098 domain-containing protein YvlB